MEVGYILQRSGFGSTNKVVAVLQVGPVGSFAAGFSSISVAAADLHCPGSLDVCRVDCCIPIVDIRLVVVCSDWGPHCQHN